MTKDQVKEIRYGSQEPVRLIEWNEEVSKQRFDKPLTNKIG